MLRRILILLAPAVAIAVLSSRPRSAHGGEPLVDDGVPAGTVAFFGGLSACPTGWAPATEVEGRLVVGVSEPAAVGQVVGTPLGDREDRTHSHATLDGQVLLPVRNIAGANGGNAQGARSGMHRTTGSAGAAPSGLPFVQVRACARL